MPVVYIERHRGGALGAEGPLPPSPPPRYSGSTLETIVTSCEKREHLYVVCSYCMSVMCCTCNPLYVVSIYTGTSTCIYTHYYINFVESKLAIVMIKLMLILIHTTSIYTPNDPFSHSRSPLLTCIKCWLLSSKTSKIVITLSN